MCLALHDAQSAARMWHDSWVSGTSVKRSAVSPRSLPGDKGLNELIKIIVVDLLDVQADK